MALCQEMPLWIPKWKKPTGMPLPKPKIGDVNVVPLVVHIHPTILATSVGWRMLHAKVPIGDIVNFLLRQQVRLQLPQPPQPPQPPRQPPLPPRQPPLQQRQPPPPQPPPPPAQLQQPARQQRHLFLSLSQLPRHLPHIHGYWHLALVPWTPLVVSWPQTMMAPAEQPTKTMSGAPSRSLANVPLKWKISMWKQVMTFWKSVINNTVELHRHMEWYLRNKRLLNGQVITVLPWQVSRFVIRLLPLALSSFL